jgi:hypothetical protein
MRAFAIAGLIVLAGLFAACGSEPGPASTASRYVALGDSNTSGAGLPGPLAGAPKNCFRTENGYPSIAAEALGQKEFATVACSGAGMSAFAAKMALYPDGDESKRDPVQGRVRSRRRKAQIRRGRPGKTARRTTRCDSRSLSAGKGLRSRLRADHSQGRQRMLGQGQRLRSRRSDLLRMAERDH